MMVRLFTAPRGRGLPSAASVGCVAVHEICHHLPVTIDDAALPPGSSTSSPTLDSAIEKQRSELLFDGSHRITGGFELRDSIRFHNVVFAYPATPAQQALDHASFTIHCGKFTAIIGKSGSGKSTIVKLLKRLFDPGTGSASGGDASSAGTITFDGIPLACFKASYLRSIVSYIPQRPCIIKQYTFAQNISMFRRATRQEVYAAAKAANCLSFIESAPLGMDTPVMWRGELSGGEKQRIEIARALLHKPQLIILDEATSNLDAETERDIQQTIENLTQLNQNMTVVAIAHRLSTLKKADRFIVMEQGKVLQEGSHEVLLAQNDQCNLYREFLQLQGGLKRRHRRRQSQEHHSHLQLRQSFHNHASFKAQGSSQELTRDGKADDELTLFLLSYLRHQPQTKVRVTMEDVLQAWRQHGDSDQRALLCAHDKQRCDHTGDAQTGSEEDAFSSDDETAEGMPPRSFPPAASTK
jgi:ABC-type multidrug transport system ATPase subunit